ncbi:MAG: ADOP family duplicated permease [bacterium]
MAENDRAAVERELGNRYQIIRTLGAGAFGAVYLARERDLHRLVAIKVLRGDRAWSDDERERLLREARTIANLSHPAVVPLLAFGVGTSGMVYMVMPYVSGQTLADRLAHDEPFDADEVRRILIELADALAYVHGEGVLHRDLKPENVLLERAGAVDDHIPPRVRLIDFGVAAFPMRDPGVNATRETWGTPHFMAPEQMFGEPELDPRSEIYSLGVLGFLLLGGRLPFDATSPTERLTQQRRGPVIPLSVCAPDAPKDLARAIERCLAYDAEQRWRRVRDFRDTLIAGASVGNSFNSFTPLALVRQRLGQNPAAIERFAAKRRKRQQPRLPFVKRIAGAFSGLDADVRFAVRAIKKAPGFSAAIIAILAIGLGATAVVLSAVEALVLRPVPVADPKALVVIQERREGPGDMYEFYATAFRYDRYLSYRDATAGVFTNIAAQSQATFSIRIGNETRSAGGLVTSGSYFDVLGVRPALGRFYDSQIDTPGGAQAVVVLGYDFWQGTLNRDSSIIGKTIHLDSRPMRVVAVAPRGFKGVIGAVFPLDVWVPEPAYAKPPIRGRSVADEEGAGALAVHWLNIFGRLRPGVTARGASEALKVIAPRVPTEDPRTKIVDASAEPVRTLPTPIQKSMERFIRMLLGVALLVLAIAAANVAGMLLARATVRTREMATRMAVGAGRARLVRQLVVESSILCAAGGGVGVLVALWLSRFLSVYRPTGYPMTVAFGVNSTVLAIVGIIVLGTALIAGIVPALHATAVDLTSALKASGAQTGERRSRLRSAFVVAQIASSVVLLSTAGLFFRSLQRSLNIDPGFRAEGVITGSVSLNAHGYDRDAAEQFYRQLLPRLRARPEIAAAAMANAAPLNGYVNSEDTKRVGHPDDIFSAQWAVADSGFIELLETPLVAGRFFTSQDRRESAPVAIINLTLAQKLWPNDPPPSIIGRRILRLEREVEVVGIIGNGKYTSLYEAPRRFGYVSYDQRFGMSRLLYVRARTTTAAAQRAATEELAKLDPNVVFEGPKLLAQDVEKFLGDQQVGARLIAVFGLVGVVLAMTGLYAVLAFGVAQRMREFGVRLALGARGADIIRLVLGHGLALVAVGLAIGLVGAIGAGRVVSRFLYDIGAVDPATLVAVPLLVVLVAVGACLVPARRGAAADPMTSLRAE